MLGIIGGTSLLHAELPPRERRVVATPYGAAEVDIGKIALVQRHQQGLPPHRINFRALIGAMAILGVDRIISIGSAGSLQERIRPGSVVIPTDYLSFAPIPSIHDQRIVHVNPLIDEELAADLARAAEVAEVGGVYVQTAGPRIETAAEVRMLTRYADIVGMTLASEATLATELGIRFASLCTVDNYAHGLSGEVPTYQHIIENARSHRERNSRIVHRIAEMLA
ncbi:MAG: MTAP family purine nucleoside phosphorylase [Methanomicrobiaceae archaeon]|nr:MTAP family purine nucleoside phosphorylase [Methanomicrobiaceae archaeon]